jgi:hypothetical protein
MGRVDDNEAAVLAAAETAADPVPDAVIFIPDGTYGGATFKDCRIEVRHGEAGVSSVVKVGEPIALAPGAVIDGANFAPGTCRDCGGEECGD